MTWKQFFDEWRKNHPWHIEIHPIYGPCAVFEMPTMGMLKNLADKFE